MLKPIDIRYWEMIHPEAFKRTQDAYPSKCDICGGSSTNPKEQKLYLYSKNSDKPFVRCHHAKCEYSGTFTSYMKQYHPHYYNMYQSENQESSLLDLMSQFGQNSQVSETSETNESIDNTSVTDNGPNLELYDLDSYFIPIQNHYEAYEYIKSRKIPINNDWMYSTIDLQIGDTLYKVSGNVIIPLKHKNKWYGFYSRNIHQKEFITFVPSNNQGYKVWNWFNIDKTKPVYIFEAIFDAIASGKTNCIATLGGSLNNDRLNELDHPILCYDNDNAGLELSLKDLKKKPNTQAVILDEKYSNVKDYNTFTQKHNLEPINVSYIMDQYTFDNFNAQVRINMRLENIKNDRDNKKSKYKE